MQAKKLKVGVLISGRGSNLKALIDACSRADFPAEIVVVISNKADAFGLTHAKNANIKTDILSHKNFPSREAFDQEMDKVLRAHKVELVCMAGFMRLLSEWFTDEWHDRLINIHPSLLPSFKGLNAQAQALEAGVAISGCTVHFVRPEMDAGPIILQAAVAVHATDTNETLEARILEAEHQCYPLALRLIGEKRISIKNEKVLIENSTMANTIISTR